MATFAIAAARGAGFAAARDVLNAARMLKNILPILFFAACVPPEIDHAPIDAVPEREALTPIINGNGINYYGGRVLSGPTVYLLFYGNFANRPAPAVITDFVKNVGGSPYWGILSTYTDGSRTPLANALHYGGAFYDNYSHGTTVATYNDHLAVLTHALTSPGGFALDANGIYVLVASSDVNVSPPPNVCAWHSLLGYGGMTLPYAVIPESTAISTCAYAGATPNDPVADAMTSSLAHELEESTTDGLGNGWFDFTPVTGGECADKCAWSFGTTYTAPNGSQANLHLGTRDYLVQENWVNRSLGYCAMQVENRDILTVEPGAGGSVSGGVSCPASSSCSQSFLAGTTVTLSAQPISGVSFAGWSGCDSVSGSHCTVTLAADRTVHANFRCVPKVDNACVSACMAECFGLGVKTGCKSECTAECTSGCGTGGP
jgi:Phosphate-induced protein 1 conserved region/Divergent InlB B-repeat domain